MRSGSDISNVLIVETCEDGTVGGSHRLLYDLVKRLDRTRFRSFVLFHQTNLYVDLLSKSGVPVYCWDDIRRREQAPANPFERVRRLFAGIRRRIALIRDLQIDIVHLNNTPTFTIEFWLPACRLTHTRLVAHMRGLMKSAPDRLDGVRRYLAGHCDEILSMSAVVSDSAIRVGIPRRRISVVYDGVDLSEWAPWNEERRDDARRSLDIPADKLVVLIPGNLKRWKGQQDAIESFRMLPRELRLRCRVLLAGGTANDPEDQIYAAGLRTLADTLYTEGGPLVTFLGSCQDMPLLYASADLVVHCSTDPEPWGMVVLEALAMGRPVIASSLGGPSEMFPQGSEMLVDPRDHRAFASALEKVLANDSVRKDLAVNARQHASRFDCRTSTEQIAQVYSRHRDT